MNDHAGNCSGKHKVWVHSLTIKVTGSYMLNERLLNTIFKYFLKTCVKKLHPRFALELPFVSHSKLMNVKRQKWNDLKYMFEKCD